MDSNALDILWLDRVGAMEEELPWLGDDSSHSLVFLRRMDRLPVVDTSSSSMKVSKDFRKLLLACRRDILTCPSLAPRSRIALRCRMIMRVQYTRQQNTDAQPVIRNRPQNVFSPSSVESCAKLRLVQLSETSHKSWMRCNSPFSASFRMAVEKSIANWEPFGNAWQQSFSHHWDIEQGK